MTEEFISVEPAGEDCFVGLAGKTDEPRTFGGLFAAQVLSAAAATVDGRFAPPAVHKLWRQPPFGHTRG
jgi:acyl-CoA thioesterase